MANRAANRMEPIAATVAGVIVRGEAHPASSLAMNSLMLAFEQVLASLARLEARLDALERRAVIAQHPARPDPDPPDENWRRERPDPGRQTAIFTSATTTLPKDRLGFGGRRPSLGPLHAAPPGASLWDRSGETIASHQQLEFVGPLARSAIQPPRIEQQSWDRNGAGVEGFRRRRSTAWDNPVHRLDGQPGGVTTEWGRYGAENDGFVGRRFTAWDKPAHRFDDQPGRLPTEWDNAWSSQEVGHMVDQPRYEHYRVEQPRYDQDLGAGKSEVGHNALETGKIDDWEGFNYIKESFATGTLHLIGLLSDGSRLPDDASHLLGSSDAEGVNEGRIAAVTCDRSSYAETMGVSSENSSCDVSSGPGNRMPAVTFRESPSVDSVYQKSDENVYFPKRSVVLKDGKKGSCYRCQKGNRFAEKEYCLVFGANYC